MAIKKTVRFASLLGLFLLLVVIMACSSNKFKGWTEGRVLYLYTPSNAQLVDYVAYMDQKKDHYVIKPSKAGDKLAVLNVTVVNPKSARVLLTLSTTSASIEDAKGNPYPMLDPFKNATQLTTADPLEGKYSPFLWGAVELIKNYQVQGWLVFEVPSTFKPAVLQWNETESIVAPLPK